MKTLPCENMGFKCDYVAVGKNNDAVVMDIMKHSENAHPEDYRDFLKEIFSRIGLPV